MRAEIAAFVVGCVLASAAAGCSSPPPRSTPSTPTSMSAAVRDELIHGIGATRANWDASHTLNTANNNGSDYGDDPSLPSYVTNNGAVYRDVDDLGTGRIHGYTMAMHTVDVPEALRQLGQELPSDATVAWDLPRDRCYRLAFNSRTLQDAEHVMAEAELQYIQPDGTMAANSDRFNIASIWLEDVGSPPDPEKGC